MKDLLIKIRLPLIVGVVCLLIGRYVLAPQAKVTETIKIVEVEKVVKEDTKKTNTKIKETTRPDGSKVTETEIVEDSSRKETSTKDTTLVASKTIKTGSKLSLSLLAIKDTKDLRNTDYGVTLSVPLIGNLNVVGMVTTSKLIGLGIGIDF